VLGVRPVAGRLYDPAFDGPTQTDRIVINASAARLLGYASPDDAVGKTLLRTDGARATQIVGVAPELRHRSARDRQPPSVYLVSQRVGMFIVKARLAPETV